MKKLMLFLLLFLNALHVVTAQEEESRTGVILAFSGLKLREKPSFDAKTIVVIPFAAKVARNEAQVYNPDRRLIYTADSIPGYWESVTWKGKTGYAFSAFIGTEIQKMDKEFYLLFEDQGWCWSDAYASPAYHYYGLFLNRDSTKAEIRKIRPSFIQSDEGMGGIAIHADEKQRSLFLFATRAPFSEEGFIKNHLVFPEWQQEEKELISIPKSNIEIFSKMETVDDERHRKIFYLRDSKTKKTQAFPEEFKYYFHINLVWCGDLDRDGVQDFMLHGHNEHSGASILYLSRNPAKGKLMKMAGIYYWGDCC